MFKKAMECFRATVLNGGMVQFEFRMPEPKSNEEHLKRDAEEKVTSLAIQAKPETFAIGDKLLMALGKEK